MLFFLIDCFSTLPTNTSFHYSYILQCNMFIYIYSLFILVKWLGNWVASVRTLKLTTLTCRVNEILFWRELSLKTVLPSLAQKARDVASWAAPLHAISSHELPWIRNGYDDEDISLFSATGTDMKMGWTVGRASGPNGTCGPPTLVVIQP
jgi:hypothetical protein